MLHEPLQCSAPGSRGLPPCCVSEIEKEKSVQVGLLSKLLGIGGTAIPAGAGSSDGGGGGGAVFIGSIAAVAHAIVHP